MSLLCDNLLLRSPKSSLTLQKAASTRQHVALPTNPCPKHSDCSATCLRLSGGIYNSIQSLHIFSITEKVEFELGLKGKLLVF